MPNHFHALVWVQQSDVAAAPVAADDARLFRRGNQNESVITLMHDFKSRSTSAYIKGVKRGEYESFNGALWQRSYYDHIIRKTESLERVREYINSNPARWAEDMFHPNSPKK